MTVEGVVIPAGGASSRMVSITRGGHKALLPLGGRPIIDHVIEEIISAGLRRITVVVPANDDSLKIHLRELQLNCGIYLSIVQQSGAGVANAILEGASDLGCDKLLVVWCDEVFLGANRSAEVVCASEQFKEIAIALRRVPRSSHTLCGMAQAAQLPGSEKYFSVGGICEKPRENTWEGDMASVGGYVITERVLETLRSLSIKTHEEVPLSAALDSVARDSRIIGVEIPGIWFDCGNPDGYRRAVSAFDGR